MIHARKDYNRIQDPAANDPSLIPAGHGRPIGEDEPVFLVRASDRAAPATVRAWADLYAMQPAHDPEVVRMARDHADRMEEWQKNNTRKTATVPRSQP